MSSQKQKPSTKCSGCNDLISKGNILTCSKTTCNANYHPECIGGSAPAEKLRATWICPACVCNRRKVGDNSSTPVRHHLLTEQESSNVTVRSHRVLTADSQSSDSLDLKSVMDEIKLMRNDMLEVKNQLHSLTDSITQCQEKITSFSDFFESTRLRLQLLEEKQAEVCELKSQISHLQEQLVSQAQTAISNELEVIGLPETANENLQHCVLVLAQKVGVPLLNEDIDWVSRVGPKKNMRNKSTGDISDNQSEFHNSRPLVVRLLRKTKRDEILKAARVRRNISPKDMDIGASTQKLYINERLTSDNRRLFREARIRARHLGYKFCWIHNGIIHVRKDEGRGYPAVQIRSWASLEEKLHLPAEIANPPTKASEKTT